MPGSNAGTGHALTFRCAKCKRGRDWRRSSPKGTNYEATGRSKQRAEFGGVRTSRFLVEYRCLDCGHVGWSKHADMDRAIARLTEELAAQHEAGERSK